MLVHIKYIWYFVRTGQFRFFKCDMKFVGPRYDWYDGPHYALGFWFFGLALDGYKDYDRGISRYRLIGLVNKLLNKKF